jgi:regulation of enolase protein 1 (concanavalin A-like superfamily)
MGRDEEAGLAGAAAKAGGRPSAMTIAGLPVPLQSHGALADAVAADGELTLAAGAHTDWFADPGTGALTLGAPALLGSAAGDFMLAARVEVAFAAAFDAGALVLWHDDRTWAKLCFEYSPQAQPMVVSVVTHGVSDDCNSAVITGNVVWLRLAAIGAAHAFHYSADGDRWHFVRHFRLGGDGPARFGFEAQSPTGGGCEARFTHIRFDPVTLAQLRDGS